MFSTKQVADALLSGPSSPGAMHSEPHVPSAATWSAGNVACCSRKKPVNLANTPCKVNDPSSSRKQLPGSSQCARKSGNRFTSLSSNARGVTRPPVEQNAHLPGQDTNQPKRVQVSN